jgi:hypothetical protein
MSFSGPEPNKDILTDWLVASALRRYDVFVLLTTQGQYANIFKQTKPSVLIGWDSVCKNSAGMDSNWKTDKISIGHASVYCPLEKVLNNKHPLANIMFEKFYSKFR